MDIKEVRRNWNRFGRKDPLWSILTAPEKKGRKWTVGDFFATGESDVLKIMEYAGSLDIDLKAGKALDFGCGVGRLTQPLAERFDKVCGVDISGQMIELADEYNRHPENCSYHLNANDDLALFQDDTFDFILTVITLQHLEPRYTKKYILEFFRVLAPDGLLAFQLPSRHLLHSASTRDAAEPTLKQRIKRVFPPAVQDFYDRLKKLVVRKEPVMEMWGIERDEVVRFCEHNGSLSAHRFAVFSLIILMLTSLFGTRFRERREARGLPSGGR